MRVSWDGKFVGNKGERRERKERAKLTVDGDLLDATARASHC